MNIYHIAPKRSGHAFVGNMVKSWVNDNYIDCENMIPKRADICTKDIIILQTRNLYNWYASYAASRIGKNINNSMVRSWYEITKEFFKTTNYFLNHKVIRVYFDEFVKSRKYREKICEQLKGNYNEDYLDYVGVNGNGSSFDFREKKGSEMDVNNRWQLLNANEQKQLYKYHKDIVNYWNNVKT